LSFDLEALLQVALVLGVLLLVVAVGIRARVRQPLRLLLSRPALAFRAVVAMYVALPAFALLLIWVLPLPGSVAAVLLGFAVSPVLPPWAKNGNAVGGRDNYVIGVELLSALVAILLVPVFIWLISRMFGVATRLDPLAVEGVLLFTFAAPLAVGMAITRHYPDAAPRIATIADRVGGTLVLMEGVLIFFVHGRAVLDVIGQGTLVAILAMVLFGLFVGHLLGGPHSGNRGALATATVSRHPAVALLLASAAFPEHQTAVMGAVLLYLTAALLITIPYERWRESVASRHAP
jgi:BASS family bile acid:Na+ symporter